MKRYDESLKTIRNALKIDPENVNLLDTYGEIFQLSGQYEEAIEQYHNVIEKEPEVDFIHETYIKMGQYFKELGDHDKALINIKKGKEIAIRKQNSEWIEKANKLLSDIDKLNMSI